MSTLSANTCSICLDPLDKDFSFTFGVARNQQIFHYRTTHKKCFKLWRTCAIHEQGSGFYLRKVYLPPRPSICWHQYKSIHLDENAMNALPDLKLEEKDLQELAFKILKAPIVSRSNSFEDDEQYLERYSIVKQQLIKSSKENQPSIVEKILNSSHILLNVNQTTEIRLYPEDRSFALWAASEEGHDQIVKLLLDHDKKIPQFKFNKEQKGKALELAIRNRREILVKGFLGIETIPNHFWDLSDPLADAASNGETDTIDELLKYDLILRTEFPSVAKLGLALYARVTALINAAKHGHITVVKQLLTHNDQLKERSYKFTDDDLGKALEAAAAHNHSRIVRLLLSIGRVPQQSKNLGALSAITSLNQEMFNLLINDDLSLDEHKQAIQSVNELRSHLEPDDLESISVVGHMSARLSQNQTRLSENNSSQTSTTTLSEAPTPPSYWWNLCTLQ